MPTATLTRSVLVFGALAIAACATSGGTTEDGTGTVSGGGRSDSGGDGADPYGTSDGAAPDDGSMTMGDSGLVLTDGSTHDTGASDTGAVDAGATGHIECPTTTTKYADEYLNATGTETPCTMGGPECLANVECCFIDLCVQYPAP